MSVNENILVFWLGKSSLELLEAQAGHVNDHGRLLGREMFPREEKTDEDEEDGFTVREISHLIAA